MTTFADIETAVTNRLREKGLAAAEVDLDTILMAKSNPSFCCRITSFAAEKLTIETRKIIPVVSVFVCIKNLKSDKDRRQAFSSVINAIVSVLSLQTLGIAITPLFILRGTELVEQDLADSGIVVWRLDFKTSFHLAMDEESAENLLELGLSYLLTPGDDVADASDDLWRIII